MRALALIILLATPFRLLAFCFDDAAALYGVNSRLLEGIAMVESELDAGAVHLNPDGSTDLGLMQVNSFWVKVHKLDRTELLLDPCYNVLAGARILKGCVDRFGYTWEAVGCYNASEKQKQIGYVWKVFLAMKRQGITTAPPPERDEPPAPSLLFEVRDRYAPGGALP
jgi:soluble lytic murein transglycosylase-like protein